MARPRLIIIAGPPGSGKTRYFPAFGVDSFNIDDKARENLRAASHLLASDEDGHHHSSLRRDHSEPIFGA
jgi:hypothetical protein